ncbi:MAG: hypothetical protein L6R41_006641 [Letrouitia leprolyta]|nr:MAG: hypothetical protein L6R41_006641 [Letrouitia leprolyta]
MAPGLDDWTMLAACVIVCGIGSLQIIESSIEKQVTGAELGDLGRDGQVRKPPGALDRAKINLQVNYIFTVIEKVGNGLIKLSVLFFYRRIFATASFILRTNIFIILIVAWTVAFFLAQIFVCTGEPKILLAFAITDVIGDLAVLTLPYFEIAKLQMIWQKKVGVAAIFMLGLL